MGQVNALQAGQHDNSCHVAPVICFMHAYHRHSILLSWGAMVLILVHDPEFFTCVTHSE